MTKGVSILIMVALLTSSMLHAQSKKVALGLAFNPTLNWFKSKSSIVESDGSKMGFAYGLMADFNFGENYAYATGLFINNGGGKFTSSHGSDTSKISVESNVKIQSVRMPITLKMQSKEIGYFKYFGTFGFNVDYIINASSKYKVNGGAEQEDGIKDELSPVDLSLSVGIGFLYNLSGTTNFMVGLTFNNGFIDLYTDEAEGEDPLNFHQNQLALNLGVLF